MRAISSETFALHSFQGISFSIFHRRSASARLKNSLYSSKNRFSNCALASPVNIAVYYRKMVRSARGAFEVISHHLYGILGHSPAQKTFENSPRLGRTTSCRSHPPSVSLGCAKTATHHVFEYR